MALPKKRAPRGSPKQDPLAALRMADMVISKPFLPVELIAQVVDHLTAADMISVARVSRKMHEVIYEDARWVQRLKRMGAWNDVEARQVLTGRKSVSQPRRRPTIDLATINGKGRPEIHVNGVKAPRPSQDHVLDGFDTISFSNPISSNGGGTVGREAALFVLQNVKSIRGQARQEYGKVHKCLNPFYQNALTATSYDRTLIFSQYSMPQQRADMLAHVKAFAMSDPSPGSTGRDQKLAELMSSYDTAALLEFRSGYEYRDIAGRMKQYAGVMYTLTGGQASVDLFLNDNRLIAKRSNLGSVSDCVDYSLGYGQLSLERVQAYFDRLGESYREEATVIKTVFPQSTEVSLLFLERIGEEILSPFLTALFADARTRSTSVYLRVISGSLHATSKFVQDFALPEDADEETIIRASNVLVRLFAPHLQLYLDEELAFFKQKAENEVERWDKNLSEQAASTEGFLMSNINRQADKKDFMASFKKVVMMPVNILPSFTSRSSAKKADSSQAISRPESPAPRPLTPNLPAEAPSDELAAKAALMSSRLDNIRGLFSIDVALNLIHAAKSSLERAAQFIALGGPPGDIARERCSEIYLILIDTIGNKHVRTGFDRAIEHLSAYNPRAQSPSGVNTHKGPVVAPLTTFLELVNVGDLIQQMLDVFFEQEIVAMSIARRDDFIAAPVKEKRKFEQMLDEHVASGLGKGIDVLMDEVEYLCATEQLPTDFNPVTQVFDAETANKRSSVFGVGDIDVSPTTPCLHIIDIISKHVAMLQGSTEKALIDVFVQEVAQRLFQALVKHIKRQRVSPLGAMRLLSGETCPNLNYIKA